MTDERTIGPNPRGIDLGGETVEKPLFPQSPTALNVGFIRHLIEVSVQSFGDPMRDVTDAEVGSIMVEAVKRAGTTRMIGAQLVPQIVGSVVELRIVDVDDAFAGVLDLIRIKDRVFVPETFEVVEDIDGDTVQALIAKAEAWPGWPDDDALSAGVMGTFLGRIAQALRQQVTLSDARRQFDEDDGA